MDGVFVTGTDTDVGKTVVSAALMRIFGPKARYWKPVQTGTLIADDTRMVGQLTDLPEEQFLSPSYRFPDPLSPHLAASKWNKVIELEGLLAQYKRHRQEHPGFYVVEGAGGLMVPLSDRHLMVDLISALGLPVLLVAEDKLGAINHSLLTIQALRERDIAVLGVVMTKSSGNYGNAGSIGRFGKIDILAEPPAGVDAKAALGAITASAALRKAFRLPEVPV